MKQMLLGGVRDCKLSYPFPKNYITSVVTTGLPFTSNIINPLLPDNLSKWEDPLKYII